jgi:hypothetical protein
MKCVNFVQISSKNWCKSFFLANVLFDSICNLYKSDPTFSGFKNPIKSSVLGVKLQITIESHDDNELYVSIGYTPAKRSCPPINKDTEKESIADHNEMTADKQRQLIDLSIANAHAMAIFLEKANAAVYKLSSFFGRCRIAHHLHR